MLQVCWQHALQASPPPPQGGDEGGSEDSEGGSDSGTSVTNSGSTVTASVVSMSSTICRTTLCPIQLLSICLWHFVNAFSCLPMPVRAAQVFMCNTRSVNIFVSSS